MSVGWLVERINDFNSRKGFMPKLLILTRMEMQMLKMGIVETTFHSSQEDKVLIGDITEFMGCKVMLVNDVLIPQEFEK